MTTVDLGSTEKRAKALHAQGLRPGQIAERLGLSLGRVDRLLGSTPMPDDNDPYSRPLAVTYQPVRPTAVQSSVRSSKDDPNYHPDEGPGPEASLTDVTPEPEISASEVLTLTCLVDDHPWQWKRVKGHRPSTCLDHRGSRLLNCAVDDHVWVYTGHGTGVNRPKYCPEHRPVGRSWPKDVPAGVAEGKPQPASSEGTAGDGGSDMASAPAVGHHDLDGGPEEELAPVPAVGPADLGEGVADSALAEVHQRGLDLNDLNHLNEDAVATTPIGRYEAEKTTNESAENDGIRIDIQRSGFISVDELADAPIRTTLTPADLIIPVSHFVVRRTLQVARDELAKWIEEVPEDYQIGWNGTRIKRQYAIRDAVGAADLVLECMAEETTP